MKTQVRIQIEKTTQNLYMQWHIYLNNMVSEINFLSFFSGSVFNIECADEISSPATQ